MVHKIESLFADNLHINGLQTHLQAGDMIGFSRAGIMSFSRGHIPIDYSLKSSSAIVSQMNDHSFELIVEKMSVEANVFEMFGEGVYIKESHKSSKGDVVYFFVTEAPIY